jgi:5-methylcytosine-specific restriction endonuclease McrA
MCTGDPDAFASAHGVTRRVASTLLCTAEHCVPRSTGGRDTATNIVAACVTCNLRRHRRNSVPDTSAFREFVARRIRARRWHDGMVFRAGLLTRQP